MTITPIEAGSVFAIFLTVWGATFKALLNAQSRLQQALLSVVASHNEVKQAAIAVAQEASEVAAKATASNVQMLVKDKIKPFIDEVVTDVKDLTSSQHYEVMLAFLKKHPGIHVENVEAALKEVKGDALQRIAQKTDSRLIPLHKR